MPVFLSSKHQFFFIITFSLTYCSSIFASGNNNPAPLINSPNCKATDISCILKEIEISAESIENTDWKDQTFRELAKSYARQGAPLDALNLIKKITNADTKAMAIRGIGMEISKLNLSLKEKKDVFALLRKESDLISDPPSHAIALTYIAMAQAYAGDNQGAWDTASVMENSDLRNKAFGETAEIQASLGMLSEISKSLEKIDSGSYRDKSREIVSKILSDKNHLQESYLIAKAIENPYKRAQALQYLITHQNRDVSDIESEIKEDFK